MIRKHIDRNCSQKVVEPILERSLDKDIIAATMYGNRNDKVDAKVTSSGGRKYSFTSISKLRSDFNKEYYLSNFQDSEDGRKPVSVG